MSNTIKHTKSLLKNATIGKVTGDILLEAITESNTDLEGLKLTCNPHMKQSVGLLPPSPYSEDYHYYSPNNAHLMWYKLGIHKRSVSKDKIRDAVHKHIELLGKTVEDYSKEDMEALTVSVESSLLPDANYTNKEVLFSLDINKGNFIIYSANNSEVEIVVDLLSNICYNVGCLEVEIKSIDGLSDTLTSMLIDGSLKDPLEFTSNVVLVNPETKAKGSLDNQAVDSTEAHTMIESGKYFKSGKFLYDGYINFTLNDMSQLKSITFDGEIEAETEEESFEMTLDYVNLEVYNLFVDLEEKLKA